MKLLAQPQLNWQPYVFFDKAFSVSECEAIVSLGKTLQPEPARVGSGQENPEIRSSELRWVRSSKAARWIFERLGGICDTVRRDWYPFRLSGFNEPIQLTRYRAESAGHYDWHRDMGDANMSTRKLSLVCLLSDPMLFAGGELEVMGVPGPEKKVAQLTQGTVIAFPAWEPHRVLPVTGGERWTLVCWVHGPLFS